MKWKYPNSWMVYHGKCGEKWMTGGMTKRNPPYLQRSWPCPSWLGKPICLAHCDSLDLLDHPLGDPLTCQLQKNISAAAVPLPSLKLLIFANTWCQPFCSAASQKWLKWLQWRPATCDLLRPILWAFPLWCLDGRVVAVFAFPVWLIEGRAKLVEALLAVGSLAANTSNARIQTVEVI